MYIFVLECNGLRIAVCLNKTPKLGSTVEPTKWNVYMGGCPGIPPIKDSPMLGRTWRVLEQTEGGKAMILKVEEVKKK